MEIPAVSFSAYLHANTHLTRISMPIWPPVDNVGNTSDSDGVQCAVEMSLSGLLLFYTALIAPVQICLWNYDDACNIFPTLYFDVAVDSFFVVRVTDFSHHVLYSIHS